MPTNAIFFNTPLENNFLGHQFAEIYKDKVYQQFLQDKKDLTIVDIGANIGLTSYYFSQFAEKVITVEPSKEHFEIIKKMVEFNKLGHIIKPVNKAIYTESKEFDFFHNQNRTMYSLHTAVHDGSSQPEKVEAITMEQLFEEHKIDHVDLLKVDIEGSEIEVFSHPTFMRIADKIDLILTERHSWSGRHPNQLNEALKSAGFKVEKIENDADLVVARR